MARPPIHHAWELQRMLTRNRLAARLRPSLLVATIVAIACSRNRMSSHQTELNDLATRYAAAWSSQNPASLAAFYSERGSLTVNEGMPAVGRAAIAATARTFMKAFPDMVVRLERV